MQNDISFFKQRFIHYNTFTLEKKKKPVQKDHIWLVVN